MPRTIPLGLAGLRANMGAKVNLHARCRHFSGIAHDLITYGYGMKSKYISITLLAATTAAIVGTVYVFNRPASQLPKLVKIAGTTPTANQLAFATVPTSVPPETVAVKPTIPEDLASNNPLPDVQLTKAGKPKHKKPPIQDTDARAALSLVGVDPEAEQYWVSAINNPNLPAEERKDLIEDLNEDGLSDPHHPGPQDMPVILNRIQLIEELAPNSMDQVNADAFAEAHKDLVNLANGQPAD